MSRYWTDCIMYHRPKVGKLFYAGNYRRPRYNDNQRESMPKGAESAKADRAPLGRLGSLHVGLATSSVGAG